MQKFDVNEPESLSYEWHCVAMRQLVLSNSKMMFSVILEIVFQDLRLRIAFNGELFYDKGILGPDGFEQLMAN